MCSMRSSSVSTVPHIIVAVDLRPARCAMRMTSSHCPLTPCRSSSACERDPPESRPPTRDAVEPCRHERSMTVATGT